MSFESFVLAWIGIAFIAFAYLLQKPAPYGRHVQKGWGPIVHSRVAWLVMETPAFIIVLWYGLMHLPILNISDTILIGLFLIHYFNRCFIYPFRLQTREQKMPLTIVLSAVVFNMVNGNILGHSLTLVNSGINTDSKFFLGVLFFVVGIVINILSDEILIKIRRNNDGYSIPNGWTYKYISCPNYLGELMEWFGFALAAGNIGAWSFFIWTCANLIPRALANHSWYQSNFPDYPKKRKAVLPFLL